MAYDDDARADAVLNADRNRQFLGLVVSVALILIFAGIGVVMMFTTQSHRGIAAVAKETIECTNNLRAVMIALHHYHNEFNSLPPAWTTDAEGNRLHSWRTLILPQLGYEPLYRDIRLNEPWDSEYNRQFQLWMPREYACPADPDAAALFYTSYMWVIGPDTISDGPEARSLVATTRGTSRSVGVVEVLATRCWMEPVDVPEADLAKGINHSATEGVGSRHTPGGINVGMLDGSTRFFDNAHMTLKEDCQIRVPSAPGSSTPVYVE